MQYAGDITSLQAWEFLSSDESCMLIDVRTSAELTFVGRPDLLQNSYTALPLYEFPDMILSEAFMNDLKLIDKNKKLLFLCRSGSRSRSAAFTATEMGFKECYNISDGFEGEIDENGHRGNISGWKAFGLPWRQT